eukprot:scaffold10222_cov135-Isochrysis_galbana.AAC.3
MQSGWPSFFEVCEHVLDETEVGGLFKARAEEVAREVGLEQAHARFLRQRYIPPDERDSGQEPAVRSPDELHHPVKVGYALCRNRGARIWVRLGRMTLCHPRRPPGPREP